MQKGDLFIFDAFKQFKTPGGGSLLIDVEITDVDDDYVWCRVVHSRQINKISRPIFEQTIVAHSQKSPDLLKLESPSS